MLNKNSIELLETSPHTPVLLSKILEYLEIQDSGHYLDCTFGAGGYTKAILNSGSCRVTALDRDLETLKYANLIKNDFSKRFNFIQTNFVNAKSKLQGTKFDAIILDLGVSSMQLDIANRGFSFMKDGPLDMRMGDSEISAAQFIADSSEETIANIIYKYGEEVQSRQIAKAIVSARNVEPITTTLQLAKIIRSAMHFRKGKIDPATKTFQAIRIHINRELESLEKILSDSKDMLLPKGRILIVSFHSLEDSIVKHFFKQYSHKKIARSKYAKHVDKTNEQNWINIITKKPIIPSRDEIRENPRSRSAKLRVAENIGGVL